MNAINNMIKREARNFYYFCLIFVFMACEGNRSGISSSGRESDIDGKRFIRTENTRFIGPNGGEIILKGINLVNKNTKDQYLGPRDSLTFRKLSGWGFNCVRLGIIWDGLEPEPGIINESYLKEIDKRIEWAEENNIWVLLDMHQDLYSVKFSDGAPEWATLDEDLPHVTGEIWSDSYLISPAVQKSFDNFWKNAPASDGLGIQDHFIQAWMNLAERYSDNETVIGYDILNEPFAGTPANQIMPQLLAAYARLYSEVTGEDPPAEEELIGIWSTEESRLEAIKLISDTGSYKTVIDAISDINDDFETGILSSFYQRVRDSIRKVDENHILFLEHGYFNNNGLKTSIRPVLDETGHIDPLQAYAPHAYDLVTDTRGAERPSYERLDFIYSRIEESSRRLNLPVLLGEYGAFYKDSPGTVETADHISSLIEKHSFSSAYWSYYEKIHQHTYFTKGIIRPYPAQISGKLIDYSYNSDNGIFICRWKEDAGVGIPTMIFIPELERLNREDIEMIPESEDYSIQPESDTRAGFVILPVSGSSDDRTVKLSFSVL